MGTSKVFVVELIDALVSICSIGGRASTRCSANRHLQVFVPTFVRSRFWSVDMAREANLHTLNGSISDAERNVKAR